ncbi:hypothetical protein HDU93_009362 [Gonapodya sp. JEL0774]|nr:hypothetical protein HDU93_009362 [Gonapodya sp. JEL0774]
MMSFQSETAHPNGIATQNGAQHIQHPSALAHKFAGLGINGGVSFGDQAGHFSDLVLRFQGPQVSQDTAFRLHRIVVAQSPYIAQVLSQNQYEPAPLDIVAQVVDPHITQEGLHLALAHLYGSYSLPLLAAPHPDTRRRSALLRSALASACLLHLPDLASHAAELCKSDIHRDSVTDYCAFVTSDAARGYGPWARELRDSVTQYLCRDAAKEAKERVGSSLGVWEEGTQGEAYRELVGVFAELPFDWLKRIVESRAFDCPLDMDRWAIVGQNDATTSLTHHRIRFSATGHCLLVSPRRFNFAKEVVTARVRLHRARPNEENVLLAFGGKAQGQANVAIVRRVKTAPTVQGQANGNAERKVWKAGGE